MKFIKLEHLAYRTIDGKAYIVNSKDSMLHELNGAGTFIWSLLDAPRSENEITSELTEEFAVSEREARKDAAEFLAILKSKKLIRAV